MKRGLWLFNLILLLVVSGNGCAASSYHYRLNGAAQ